LLQDHLEGRTNITVPALLYYEVANVLLFARSRPPFEMAVESLANLYSMPLDVVPPAATGANAALRLASTFGLTYYDATYVALAEALDCQVVTADQRLARRASASGRIRLLTDIQ